MDKSDKIVFSCCKRLATIVAASLTALTINGVTSTAYANENETYEHSNVLTIAQTEATAKEEAAPEISDESVIKEFEESANSSVQYDELDHSLEMSEATTSPIVEVQAENLDEEVTPDGYDKLNNTYILDGNVIYNRWIEDNGDYFYANQDGKIEKKVISGQYFELESLQKDRHIHILGNSYYFDTNGQMARAKVIRSERMNAWFESDDNGKLIYEVTPWGHYINNVRQFDSLALINDLEFYFESIEGGGSLVSNKWSYSPSKASWYYSKPNAVVEKKVTPDTYTIDGVSQKDKHISINGWVSYYYEPNGKLSKNKTIYSQAMNAWFVSDASGKLINEVTPWGHYKNNVRQFDSLVKINGIAYYYEPQLFGGGLAINKWSYSPANRVWYKSEQSGKVLYKDKVGPNLPTTVKLDRGQWKMFSLAQDNWETGCWLRTAASGINSAGGDMTPFTLIKDIKRTDDPRTGMLSHPSIINNWSLGGVCSAVWPEALVPVVQKYVPNAADLSGSSFEDIKRELANGNTVQVYYAWVTPNIRLNGERGTFYGSKDYHSVLLTGYDANGFYYQEHWGTPRNNHFSYSKLQWQYNAYGKKAISYRTTGIQP